MRSLTVLSVALALAGTACSSEEAPLHVDETPGCDPLVPEVCAFPYPSMALLRQDETSETGYRMALTAAALPGEPVDPTALLERWNEADGVPVATPFLALLPDEESLIDPASLPSPEDLGASLEGGSAVAVLDRATGERIPCWAEPDLHAESPEEQTLIIRPMKALPFGRRVAVVVTDALRLEDGRTPAAPAPFAALRDGRRTDGEALEAMRPAFDELFAFLEEHDLPRERLLLAWEVVTASEGFVLATLPAAVEAAAGAFDGARATYRVTACYAADEADRAAFGCEAEDGGQPLSAHTWRRIYGEVELPGFLDEEGSLYRDGEGAPEPRGTFTAEFVVNVPISLRDASAGEGRVVVFGHGLLVDPAWYLADDDGSEGQMELAERMGAVFVGTRWHGLSSTERDEAADVIVDFDGSFRFHDALLQGIVDQVLMAPFATGALAADPLLGAADGSGPLLETSRVDYTGISLGGIFGTTLMAVSPYVETGVLHVPAAAFAEMLPHSSDFSAFQIVLRAVYRDPRDQQLLVALTQRLFDVGDPINYVGRIAERPLTALGPKSCLWQCAIGDSQAVWYGCDMLMRTGGFPLAAPEVRPVLGLETIETPTASRTSGMQQFDPGLGMPDLGSDRVVETGAHNALRRNPEVQLQTMDYLDLDEPGRIVNHCGGPCVIDPVPVPE